MFEAVYCHLFGCLKFFFFFLQKIKFVCVGGLKNIEHIILNYYLLYKYII